MKILPLWRNVLPARETTLTAYFAYNVQNADGRNVVYIDFHVDHVWKIREKVWSARQQGENVVG
jgi:hypothetical protein